VVPLPSRCDLHNKETSGPRSDVMLAARPVERLCGHAQWRFECWIWALFRQRRLRTNLKEEGRGPETAFLANYFP